MKRCRCDLLANGVAIFPVSSEELAPIWAYFPSHTHHVKWRGSVFLANFSSFCGYIGFVPSVKIFGWAVRQQGLVSSIISRVSDGIDFKFTCLARPTSPHHVEGGGGMWQSVQSDCGAPAVFPLPRIDRVPKQLFRCRSIIDWLIPILTSCYWHRSLLHFIVTARLRVFTFVCAVGPLPSIVLVFSLRTNRLLWQGFRCWANFWFSMTIFFICSMEFVFENLIRTSPTESCSISKAHTLRHSQFWPTRICLLIRDEPI